MTEGHLEISWFYLQQKNCLFISTFASTLIKLFQLSKAWKCWETQLGDYFLITNNYSIELASFLLHSMDFLCNSLKIPHFYILLGHLEKYNKELPFGSQMLFVHCLLGKLRPLPVLFSFIYTFKKSIVDINSEPLLYCLIIQLTHF